MLRFDKITNNLSDEEEKKRNLNCNRIIVNGIHVSDYKPENHHTNACLIEGFKKHLKQEAAEFPMYKCYLTHFYDNKYNECTF